MNENDKKIQIFDVVSMAVALVALYLGYRVSYLSSWKDSHEQEYRRVLEESDQRVQRARDACLARDSQQWYVTPPALSADAQGMAGADAAPKAQAKAESCENILMTGPSGPHPCPGEGHRLVVVGDHVVCACQGVPVEIK